MKGDIFHLKEIGDVLEREIHRREKMEYYKRKFDILEEKYRIFHNQLLKWTFDVKSWMYTKNMNKKQRGWMTYHLRMINMERMLYSKFSKILEKTFKEWEKNENYVKIRPLYTKLERIWKRIEFSKEKIDEVVEMRRMIDSFDDIQMNENEKEKSDSEKDSS
jgi:hypothetical protein